MECLPENERYHEETSDSHYNYAGCLFRCAECHYQTDCNKEHGPAEYDIINKIREKTCVPYYQKKTSKNKYYTNYYPVTCRIMPYFPAGILYFPVGFSEISICFHDRKFICYF